MDGMSAARWKRAEREVAAALGGQRLPNSGRGQPDVEAPGFGRALAVQVKTTTALPLWLTAAVEQAARDAGAEGVPVVVLNEVRRGVRARRLVVLDLAVFRALIAGGVSPPEAQPMTPAVDAEVLR